MALLMAALKDVDIWAADVLSAYIKDVDIWAADVLSAYITTPCREKIWTTLGKEFGDDCDRKAIVVHMLYKLNSGCIWQDACKEWATCRALPILTCGSRNKETGKEDGTIPVSSVTLMICWWFTITLSMSWTRSTAFSY
jgi:hypothetical protein